VVQVEIGAVAVEVPDRDVRLIDGDPEGGDVAEVVFGSKIGSWHLSSPNVACTSSGDDAQGDWEESVQRGPKEPKGVLHMEKCGNDGKNANCDVAIKKAICDGN
jgi:hypothetical protein